VPLFPRPAGGARLPGGAGSRVIVVFMQSFA
jgi:hypothetical protein